MALESYKKSLSRYIEWYETRVSIMRQRVGEDTFRKLESLLCVMSDKDAEVSDYLRLLKIFGVQLPNVKHCVAMTYVVAGVYPRIMFKDIGRHHPERYKIFFELYCLLEYLGDLCEKDKINLLIGKADLEKPKTKFVKVDQGYRSKDYLFRIGYTDENFEIFYAPKNIMVQKGEGYEYS